MQAPTLTELSRFIRLNAVVTESKLNFDLIIDGSQTIEHLARRIEAEYILRHLRDNATKSSPLLQCGLLYVVEGKPFKFADRISEVIPMDGVVQVINIFDDYVQAPNTNANTAIELSRAATVNGGSGDSSKSAHNLSADGANEVSVGGKNTALSVGCLAADQSVSTEGHVRKQSKSHGLLNKTHIQESHDDMISLDSRFQQVLTNHRFLTVFLAYCRTQSSLENLLFYIYVRIFEETKDAQLKIVLAYAIYEMFIVPAAPLMINLSEDVLRKIALPPADKLKWDKTFNVEVFEDAKRYVYCLLKKFDFVHFVKTKECTEFINQSRSDRNKFSKANINAGEYHKVFPTNLEDIEKLLSLIPRDPSALDVKIGVLKQAITHLFPKLSLKKLDAYFTQNQANSAALDPEIFEKAGISQRIANHFAAMNAPKAKTIAVYGIPELLTRRKLRSLHGNLNFDADLLALYIASQKEELMHPEIDPSEKREMTKRRNKIMQLLGENVSESVVLKTRKAKRVATPYDIDDLLDDDSKDSEPLSPLEQNLKDVRMRRLQKLNKYLGERITEGDLKNGQKAAAHVNGTQPNKKEANATTFELLAEQDGELAQELKSTYVKRTDKLTKMFGEVLPAGMIADSGVHQSIVDQHKNRILGLKTLLDKNTDLYDIVGSAVDDGAEEEDSLKNSRNDDSLLNDDGEPSTDTAQQDKIQKQRKIAKLRKIFGTNADIGTLMEQVVVKNLEKAIEEDMKQLLTLQKDLDNLRAQIQQRMSVSHEGTSTPGSQRKILKGASSTNSRRESAPLASLSIPSSNVFSNRRISSPVIQEETQEYVPTYLPVEQLREDRMSSITSAMNIFKDKDKEKNAVVAQRTQRALSVTSQSGRRRAAVVNASQNELVEEVEAEAQQ